MSGAGGKIAEKLARTGVAQTVVTLGGRGCCAYDDGEYLVQPAFAVTPVDTTAAGDTFCGTLAAALAGGSDLAAAMREAAAAAALSTTRAGAQISVPTRSEVETLLTTAERRHRPRCTRHLLRRDRRSELITKDP